MRIAGLPSRSTASLSDTAAMGLAALQRPKVQRIPSSVCMRFCRSVALSPISSTSKWYGSMKSVELVTCPSAPPSQPGVDEDRRRPLVARREAGMERADLVNLEARAPAQRVHGVAAGGQQVAAAARARAHPVPPRIPVGDVGQILSPREPDGAETARLAQPPRKLEERVVAQLERDDGPDPGGANGVADANQLRRVEAGRLLEDDVLAGVGGRHRLIGVEVVRRGNRDDVDVGRLEHILVPAS